jgi:hypothetical protein
LSVRVIPDAMRAAIVARDPVAPIIDYDVRALSVRAIYVRSMAAYAQARARCQGANEPIMAVGALSASSERASSQATFRACPCLRLRDLDA